MGYRVVYSSCDWSEKLPLWYLFFHRHFKTASSSYYFALQVGLDYTNPYLYPFKEFQVRFHEMKVLNDRYVAFGRKIHLIVRLLVCNVQKSAETPEMTSLTFIETPKIGSWVFPFILFAFFLPYSLQREPARRLGKTLLVN